MFSSFVTLDRLPDKIDKVSRNFSTLSFHRFEHGCRNECTVVKRKGEKGGKCRVYMSLGTQKVGSGLGAMFFSSLPSYVDKKSCKRDEPTDSGK